MVSAILLAAGSSKRMGSQDKLLLKYKGNWLVRHVIQQLSAANIDELIIVRKDFSGNLLEEDKSGRIKVALNPNAELGMTTSIQAGVRMAKKNTNGYMICQADMPLINTAEYNEIIAAFESSYANVPGLITIPFFQNQKGNPIIFSSDYYQEILNHTEMEGCRALVKANVEKAEKLEMATKNILVDIDTPQDWAGLFTV